MELQKNLQRIILAELLVPLALFIFGAYHGVLQTLYMSGVVRANAVAGIDYYEGLTAHGVINALVLTTFFAVAFGYVVVSQGLKLKVSVAGATISLVLMLGGAVMAAAMIFTGHASVLYTFYPPLMAHPLFYVGLVLFVVGSWVPMWTWIPVYVRWRKEHRGEKTPMGVVGILATFVVWQMATLPVAFEIIVQLIPWSMGWTSGVNVMLSRTLFWFFGHPLVYFWLMPTYVMYYTMLPKLAGGKLFSDFAGRFTFMALILLSCPLGLHHQFADPGISTTSKGVQGVLTMLVVIPSLLTAFTIAASLEYAARKRGGKGLFGWWNKLPYFKADNWLFPYLFCGLVIFLFGGITGIINASYAMNNVVHNTAWVPAHFHLTVAGPIFLGILGGSLLMVTGLLKKPVVSGGMAALVPYVWMIGTFTFSAGLFMGGLRGEPRRTNLGLTYMNPASPAYRPDWWLAAHLGMIGGCIMGLAVLLFFIVLIRSLLAKADPALANVPFSLPTSEPYHDEDIVAVRNFTPWVLAAVLLCAAAYWGPVRDIAKNGITTAPGFSPDNPAAVNTTH